MELKLQDNIERLNGVGPRRAGLYRKLGIETIYDLLTFYPRDYLDLQHPVPVMETVLNQPNVIRARVYRKQGEQMCIRDSLFPARLWSWWTDFTPYPLAP